MNQVHVEAIGLQPREARIDLPQDVAAREPAIVRARPDRVEHLRAEEQLIADRRALRLQPAADVRLAAAAAVGIGGVEEVDARRRSARSISSNACASFSPIPKNAGADPMPPKLPQPRPSREILRPVDPSRRYSITPDRYSAREFRRARSPHRRAAPPHPGPRLRAGGDHRQHDRHRHPARRRGSSPASSAPPAAILAVWIAGGLYTLLGAVCLTELGTMLPQAGGYYVYARRAFGETVGFAVGWTDWLTYCAVLGYVSIGLGEFAAVLVPALAGDGDADRDRRAPRVRRAAVGGRARQQPVPGSGDGDQVRGVPRARRSAASPSAGRRRGRRPRRAAARRRSPALIVALQSVVITYGGWQSALYFTEEDRDPQRNLPRAMIGGVARGDRRLPAGQRRAAGGAADSGPGAVDAAGRRRRADRRSAGAAARSSPCCR